MTLKRCSEIREDGIQRCYFITPGAVAGSALQLLQNVVDLADVLVQLQTEGHAVTREQVARLSPYRTAHLKRFGQYVLDMEGEPAPLEPRPLMLPEERTSL